MNQSFFIGSESLFTARSRATPSRRRSLSQLTVKMTVKRVCEKLNPLQNNTFQEPLIMEWE